MTRYARAQGSKAANKREEEDATPWHVMVSNLRRAGPAPHMKKERHDNPEDFDERDDAMIAGGDSDDDIEQNREIKKSTKKIIAAATEEKQDESVSSLKHKPTNLVLAETNQPEEATKKKKPRAQNKCLNCKKPGHLKKECPELPEERRKELQELYTLKTERKGQGTGRKKNKNKKRDDSETLEDGNNKKDNEFKRVKVLKDKTGQIVGEKESMFQGFRVKEEDAKRLRDLQKKLTAAKVTPQEMKEVLKRERRRAEKALANSIKNVCYNCRQPGHMLADCPGVEEEVKDTKSKSGASNHEIMSGICFKCGSAEHTSKDCRSKRKGEQAYKFATCFICKQTGHLAKSCPDNPRGLYPKGGGCRFCGSVEHLKNDCTRKTEKDSREEIRVGIKSYGDSIEDEPEEFVAPSEPKKKKKKHGPDTSKNSSKVVSF